MNPLPRRKFQIKTRRIAVLHTLGDYGISQYIYELCEGLAEHGVTADVYTTNSADLPPPRGHRRFPVLGSVLFKQKAALRNPTYAPLAPAAPDWLIKAIQTTPRTASASHVAAPPMSAARQAFMTAELAAHFRLQNYDWVWTQWPYLEPYRQFFFHAVRAAGLPVVHTVHNVLPHEYSAEDVDKCRETYRAADALVVHSRSALAELQRWFPEVAGKAAVVPLPGYTLFPRIAGARERLRQQLGLGPDDLLALCSGIVRPYKNLEATIEAAADPALGRLTFVVTGRESGYPDLDPNDPLGRTRRQIAQLGLGHRFRLVPRFLSTSEMAELFEAADIVFLPYRQGYGSAQLLLAMTFGKAVVSTVVGGSDEFLATYEAASLIPDFSAAAIVEGVRKLLSTSVRTGHLPLQCQPSEVARTSLISLGAISDGRS